MKKNSLRTSFERRAVQPLLLLVLVAMSLPLMTLAAIEATETLQYGKPETFDTTEFRRMVREHRKNLEDLPVEDDDADAVEETRPAVQPCNPAAPVQEDSAVGSDETTILKWGDLTNTEKYQMRINLKHGGCPNTVLPGYRELCQILLKAKGSPYKVRAGLRPAAQTQEEFLKSGGIENQ